MLDNVGLVHMNGRVYDPALGRFLSVDPLLGDLGDSQSINPYAYVGNRPLNATDPTGYLVDGGLSIYVGKFIVDSIVSTIILRDLQPRRTCLHRRRLHCPASRRRTASAYAIRDVSHPCAGLHGPLRGRARPWDAPDSRRRHGLKRRPTTSTRRKIFEQLLLDLGINAIDVLILSTVHDAKDAYDAAKRGEPATAIIYVGLHHL